MKKISDEWVEQSEKCLLTYHSGETVLVGFKSKRDGIDGTIDDLFPVDISWARYKGKVIATTGGLDISLVKCWKPIRQKQELT